MPSPKSPFIRRLIQWRFLLVINFFVIVFLCMSFGREIVRSQSIEAEIAALQEEADTLVARNIEVSELKTAMQTESYIEREARLKLGMKKPGETVIVIQDDQMLNNAITTDLTDPLGFTIENVQDQVAVANPTKWWYYFFDKNTFFSMTDYE